MKTKQTIIASSIALMMCASYGASAAQKQIEYHEDQWGNVMAYGSTPIASDSVAAWGPWADFVQPAAGAPAVGFLALGAGEAYRPLPIPIVPIVPIVPVASGCEAGMACGYAVFQNSSYSSEGYGGYYGYGGSYGDGGEHPATFTARIPSTFDDSATTAWRVTSLDGTAPTYPESGELGNPYFSGNYFHFDRYDSVDGAEGHAYIGGNVNEDNIPVATGYFGRNLYSYMNGNNCEGDCYGYTSDSTYGVFVAGIVTSATDMSALRANGISAVYTGSAFNYGTPVTMQVNFGPGTWSGSWNNGADGNTWTHTPSGTTQLYVRGQVGFNASGTITGSNIQSTSVSATDGAVSGMVKGSFFGSQAAALGGVVDITKTKIAPPVDVRAVSIQQPNTYTDARYVDLFLTTKNVPQ